MSSVNYAVLNVNLATARAEPGEAILTPGVAYDGVTVLALPAGAVCGLAFGDNKQPVPLTQVAASYTFKDACDNPYSVDEALRFSNPVGGGVVSLLISFGAGASNLSASL